MSRKLEVSLTRADDDEVLNIGDGYIRKSLIGGIFDCGNTGCRKAHVFTTVGIELTSNRPLVDLFAEMGWLEVPEVKL